MHWMLADLVEADHLFMVTDRGTTMLQIIKMGPEAETEVLNIALGDYDDGASLAFQLVEVSPIRWGQRPPGPGT